MSALSLHDRAVIALCIGFTTVADGYHFALMLTDARRRAERQPRKRTVGTPAVWLGAALSTGARS